MYKTFEAYINSKGELQDFSDDIIFYQGNIAFIYKNHKKIDNNYYIYGNFTYADDANDMERGHKFFQLFPGYIEYDTEQGLAIPKMKNKNPWDIFEKDEYDLDDLCQLVVDEIIQ